MITPQLAHTFYETAVGTLTITAHEKGLVQLNWVKSSIILGDEDPNHPILRKTVKQLDEYFAKKRQQFDLPLDMRGTTFQKEAWQALQEIGYGKTCSYSEQAKRIGRSKAFRAVGSANGKNPLPIIVPCHRVISASGKMAGYTGGLDKKIFLLAHESNN